MFKRTSLMALLIGAFAFTTLPSAEVEAAGYKSSRSSNFSSSRSSSYSSRSSYSAPKSYTAPRAVQRSSSPYSKPSAAATRPASANPYNKNGMRANDSSYRNQSAGQGYRKPVQGMKSTPYGQRPSGYKPRQVSSPLSSRGSYAPRTTVVNRNYYGSNRNYGGGYNRGFGGGYGGGYGGMGGSGGPGLGSMLLAGAGGAILGNMLYNGFSHTPSHSGATTRTDTITPVQADGIRQEQRIEDKLDQVNDKLDAQAAPQTAMAGPQGYLLPEDAPLMMSPDFYKLGGSM